MSPDWSRSEITIMGILDKVFLEWSNFKIAKPSRVGKMRSRIISFG